MFLFPKLHVFSDIMLYLASSLILVVCLGVFILEGDLASIYFFSLLYATQTVWHGLQQHLNKSIFFYSNNMHTTLLSVQGQLENTTILEI